MGTKRSKQSQQDIDDLCGLLGACEESRKFIRKHGITEKAWRACKDPAWLAQLCDTVDVPWRYRLMAAALCVQAFRNRAGVQELYDDMVAVASGPEGTSLDKRTRPKIGWSCMASDLWWIPDEPDYFELLGQTISECAFCTTRDDRDADRDFSNRIRLVIPWPMVKDCIDKALAKHRAERDVEARTIQYDPWSRLPGPQWL